MKINKYLNKSILMFITFSILSIVLIWGVELYERNNSKSIDFSFNKYSSISDSSAKALKKINNQVEIYTTNGSNDKQLESLLNNYTKLNKNIKYNIINYAEHPEFTSKFANDGKNQLRNDSIVINSPSTGRFKILNPEDMMSYGYDINSGKYAIEGLKYEKNIIESILSVSSAIEKKVFFLNGHGEKDENSLSYLLDYLKSNGYTVEFLKKLDGPLENGTLLAIISPQSDLSDEELKYIKDFEEQSGSILFALNYSDNINNLKNFSSLLSTYGIKVKDGVVLADSEDKQSYYKDAINIIPYMQEGTILSSLISTNRDILLMAGSKAFELNSSDIYSPISLLKSGKTAKLYKSLNDTKQVDNGEFTLCAYSEKINSKSNISRLIIIGNDDTIISQYLSSITFSADFTQAIINALLPEQAINIDVAAKPAFRRQLLPVSKAVGLTIIITIPVIILLYSIIVIKKRKSL